MQPQASRTGAQQTPDAGGRPGRGEIVALLSALVWAAICAALMWTAPGAISPLGALLPLGLIVVAYFQARQLRRMRAEAKLLSGEIAAARRARAAAEEVSAPAAPDNASATTPLFRTDHRPAAPPSAAPAFASRREHRAPVQPAPEAPKVEQDGQVRLPLGTDLDGPPALPVGDMIRALSFPSSPEDTDGFRALRRALKQPDLAPLVQAAQDVLTLLSQVGLYMDDLEPDRARPELWRRFAAGERGGAVTALGGIRTETALSVCVRELRSDPVFRDVAHHFMRHFDRFLSQKADSLDDADLAALTDTRTARAFMLLGRVAGAFD